MELLLKIIIIGIVLWHVISDILNRHERKTLLDRIMAKDYQEFNYYDKKYRGDLSELNKIRKEERKTREEEKSAFEEEPELTPQQKKFLSGMESDWGEEEIDTEKLREIVNEPPRTDEIDSGRERA